MSTTTYRIAEVAERSGFTPATLRYYEDIGLVTPAGRTAAGYRLYDDASLERLRFIARAKHLDCSLDEIAEIATAWEGGECRPLQDRLRGAVETKLADARAGIGELTGLVADLERTAAALGAHRPYGPCDDACGCTGTPGAASLLVAGPDSLPIACSLDVDDMSGRLDEWRAVLRDVVARHPLADGVRLELGADADIAAIARLAAAEQSCCRFFAFALVMDARGVALEVHAPAEADDVVTALFGV
jgi:DNA-binding transcriptional MerR regulator